MTKKIGIIYKVSNNIDDKVYIGYTTSSLALVKAQHRYELKNGINSHSKLNEAFRLYGTAAFEYEVLEEIDATENNKELRKRCRDIMSQFDSIENGYNDKRGVKPGSIADYNKGELHYKAKLTEADIRNIRFMLKQNVPVVAIADYYDVSQPNITYIKDGKTWKHVN
ncbi:hypothetical protein QT711_03155 [Sporosarcina saromensis]|uniref:Group I intron endonuclease n=1 Tax=Sporosarcina saromensis TaxID=359365 RepID=A0ABU4G5B8_9BACL|nr:hypothetical protein [Sporosarcina saromensis]MDW0112168.1 hypothetical protein [Sporosarcina saromensis]